jgi:hypothetical protein
MTLSSQKKLYSSLLLLCCLSAVLLGEPLRTQKKFVPYKAKLPKEIFVESNYKFDFISRGAVHLFSPNDLASARQIVEFEQTAKLLPYWLAVAGLRFYADGAYATNTNYASSVREKESIDLMLRDFYLQFRKSPFLIKAGFQQVVWGEALGFYFADIVNPKDNREFTIGDLSFYRLTVPMLNANLLLSNVSFQVIWIPKPFFNLTPSVGNDFAPPYQKYFPGAFRVEDERYKPWDIASSEIGLRASTVYKGWDLASFLFYYYSRTPNYEISFPGTEVVFTGKHLRNTSIGITGTKDWTNWVSRFEFIYTFNKPVDSFNTIGLPSQYYQTQQVGELGGVIGIDYTGLTKFKFGGQIAHKKLFYPPTGTLTPENLSFLSLMTSINVISEHTFDTVFSFCAQDGSSSLQLNYLLPISSQLELTVGSNLLLGNSTSYFGTFRNGSRVFLQLRGFFSEG